MRKDWEGEIKQHWGRDEEGLGRGNEENENLEGEMRKD